MIAKFEDRRVSGTDIFACQNIAGGEDDLIDIHNQIFSMLKDQTR